MAKFTNDLVAKYSILIQWHYCVNKWSESTLKKANIQFEAEIEMNGSFTIADSHNYDKWNIDDRVRLWINKVTLMRHLSSINISLANSSFTKRVTTVTFSGAERIIC